MRTEKLEVTIIVLKGVNYIKIEDLIQFLMQSHDKITDVNVRINLRELIDNLVKANKI